MTAQEIMQQLEKMGDAQTKKTLMRHGAKEPFFGVKVADLKTILKKTKKNHELSLALYKTGNTDAMYLACLMADETQITKAQLQEWVEKAYWYNLSEFAVPWVVAETPYGYELGLKWINSDNEKIASAGWATLSNVAALTPDENLDIKKYNELIDYIAENIHKSPNRVRYTMNGFLISTGVYIKDLTKKAKNIATKMGTVMVDMGGTVCKVPDANEYIDKSIARGHLGKKKKVARC